MDEFVKSVAWRDKAIEPKGTLASSKGSKGYLCHLCFYCSSRLLQNGTVGPVPPEWNRRVMRI
jgi:hypothetical protein